MADTGTVPELDLGGHLDTCPSVVWSDGTCTCRSPIGASYLVTAQVAHKREGGWIGCRQVPSFVLPGDILGIVSERHARDIATSLLREVAGDTVHSITVTVTRLA